MTLFIFFLGIPLILCGLIVTKSWPENFGDRKMNFKATFGQGLRQIVQDKKILQLGILQTIIESVMYIFVFMWTPVLMPSEPPLGMVFANFMVAIMIGSSLYTLLLSKGFRPEDTLKIILVILASSMTICCLTAGPDRGMLDMTILYVAFLMLEVAFGMYFPAMSFLKSQIIPEGHRANVMNWFRVPMNVITCSALLCLKIDALAHDKRIMFALCLILCCLGLLAWSRFNKMTERKIIDLSSGAEKAEKAALLSNDSD